MPVAALDNGEWLASRLPESSDIIMASQHHFAFVQNGVIIAAWCYSLRGDKHYECNIAAENPTWASRRLFKQITDYPFKVLKAERLTAICLLSNKKARRLISGAGFTEEAILRKFSDGRDLIIYAMFGDENGRS